MEAAISSIKYCNHDHRVKLVAEIYYEDKPHSLTIKKLKRMTQSKIAEKYTDANARISLKSNQIL